MYVLGFTGTREGMTDEQEHMVDVLLALVGRSVREAHHGDCVGADEQFHALCRRHLVPVVLHPPADDKLRAWCKGAVRVCAPEPYLKRDRIIVRQSGRMLAAPKEQREPNAARAGGTWYTVRWARKLHVPCLLVRPDGSLKVG
jgi:hypothetical protein